MWVFRRLLLRFGVGAIAAWLVAGGGWLASMALLWPFIHGANVDPRRTILSVSLLAVAFASGLLGLAPRVRPRMSVEHPLLLPVAYHVVITVVQGLLAAVVAVLLLGPIAFAGTDDQRADVVAGLVVAQAGINFVSMIAATVWDGARMLIASMRTRS